MKKMKKNYIKPTINVHKLANNNILAGSGGCSCGCNSSDVYNGHCGCNGGRGCDKCGYDPFGNDDYTDNYNDHKDGILDY